MHNEEKLFHQAILLGGSFLMMKPGTTDTAEKMYNAVVRTLGLESLAPAERVRTLLSTPQEKLVAKISKEMPSLGPIIDGQFMPAAATFSELNDQSALSLPGLKWCKRLLSIESRHDVSFASTLPLLAILLLIEPGYNICARQPEFPPRGNQQSLH